MAGASKNWLRNPRLAAHALAPTPAWLWSGDATRILWANPNGAAVFEANSASELGARHFDPADPAAAQIARLSATLPSGAMPRLERLQGLGKGSTSDGALTCICSRIDIGNNATAILVVATERTGPELTLSDRLRRLIGDWDAPVAAFSADGELLLASPSAQARLGNASNLGALGVEALARAASRDGHTQGVAAIGDVTLDRLGAGNTLVLLLTMMSEPVAPAVVETPPPAAPVVEPTPLPLPPTAKPASFPVVTQIKRGQPLRFVWHSDADDRFIVESPEFTAMAGWKTKEALGSTWKDFAAALGFDADGRVAQAIAARTTWSGISVQWPVDGTHESVPVELSGLPVFDRAQTFQGYRGFGVCREPVRLADLARRRDETAANVEAAAPSPSETKAEPQQTQIETPRPPNVVQFPAATTPDAPAALDAKEQSAFQEIARELSDRLKKVEGKPIDDDDFGPERNETLVEQIVEAPAVARAPAPARDAQLDRPILDRLPIGILVYRLNDLLYANRAFLEWTDYPSLEALREAGGLDSLFIEPNAAPAGTKAGNSSLTITTPGGKRMPVEGKLFPASWNGESALVLMLNITKAADKQADLASRRVDDENRELKAVLDTATDGVLMLDRAGRILSANRSAEALFGYDAEEFDKIALGDLFAPESQRTVLDYLDNLAREGALTLLNEGKDVIGRVKQGGLVPLTLTIGRIGESTGKYCAVFRDETARKKTEEDLIKAKQQAEGASSAKSDFLAKVSHEIRTPLNAIIGFSEVMMEERFGPLGNERYKQYLSDIHASGGHLISLLNDLLDLSKIEAGKLDLTFTGININDVAQQCVAMLQGQANRERVIIRTSLPPGLPQIVADTRSVRQILLNLLSNSIKFTGAGGQVIVSTALNDHKDVVLRVRDTGAGMSAQELQSALEPFRQLATTSRWGASGTGLGLPITKALAEANNAIFKIKSAVDDGTLVEVTFPSPRILAK